MSDLNKYFLKISKLFLFAAALTPLFYTNSVIYPYLTGKIFFFRLAVGLALVFFIAHKIFLFKTIGEFKNYLKEIFKTYSRNPLILAVSLFFISLIISTIFAVNPYQAFWGNLDRGEGFVNLVHYLIFALLIFAVFNKRDWLKFFIISLIVGLIIIFYGFLQWFKMDFFPFMPIGGNPARPGSFIGNPAFLAAYLIILIAVFGIIKPLVAQKYKILVYLPLVSGLLLIFLTRTRGAIVGIAIGLLAFLIYGVFSVNRKIKKAAIVLFLGLLGFIFVFSFTYKNQFWQDIPGFDRVSKSISQYENDESIQTRLIAWKASLEAFKENPWFGWGLEDYLTAYAKHYNPKYAVFGETWLDRAHNKFIDVLVMQGLFGLAAYLAVLTALIWWAFRKQPLVLAALFAYIGQNFFVFEEINSYILFYSILGFALASSIAINDKNENKEAENKLTWQINLKEINLFKLSSIALILFAFLLWGYSYNYAPYQQAKYANLAYNTSPTPENQKIIIGYLQKAFEPYNFSQSSIRSLLFDRFHNTAGGFNIFENSQFELISKEMSAAIDDEIVRLPQYDSRFYLRKYQLLFAMAKWPGKDALFAEAEPVIRKGIEMAPKRQEFYYALAFTLAGQNRYQESIDAARYAVKLEPRVPRAHYHLGVMYAIAQQKDEALKELEIVHKLDSDLSALYYFDSAGLLLTYKILGSADKIAELAVEHIDGKNMLNILPEDYVLALQYFANNRDAGSFIKIAGYLAQNPKLKDDMEVLIDLAEKGQWEIINKL